jgi:NIMA (never in mitosis gene a)-related kinase
MVDFFSSAPTPQVLRSPAIQEHPNIIGYRACVLENGRLHIVMEYADHGDLATQIRLAKERRMVFTEERVLFWFVQILSALHHIHNLRILHRDLKTQNIFLTGPELFVKLGDFGIAKVLEDTGSQRAMAQTLIGTPYYMSPELCEGNAYSYKSDVWALGCVLYEMTTLRHAFDGNNMCALVLKILRGTYPPVSSYYSSELRQLIERMLQTDPALRPSTGEMLELPLVEGAIQRFREKLARAAQRHLSQAAQVAGETASPALGGDSPAVLVQSYRTPVGSGRATESPRAVAFAGTPPAEIAGSASRQAVDASAIASSATLDRRSSDVSSSPTFSARTRQPSDASPSPTFSSRARQAGDAAPDSSPSQGAYARPKYDEPPLLALPTAPGFSKPRTLSHSGASPHPGAAEEAAEAMRRQRSFSSPVDIVPGWTPTRAPRASPTPPLSIHSPAPPASP